MKVSSGAKHRAPARRRGWAPRALLSAAAVPVGVLAGLAVSLVAVATGRPELAWVGVLVAGAPGVYQAVRATVLDGELRDLRRPVASPARSGAMRAGLTDVDQTDDEQPDDEQPEVDQPDDQQPDVEREPVRAASMPGLLERIGTGELQRIWDLGEAPDTGQQSVVAIVEPRLLLESAAAPSGGLVARTAEDRVYDALVLADADELTRALELPVRAGRHAAPAPLDLVLPHDVPERARPRRGRHAA